MSGAKLGDFMTPNPIVIDAGETLSAARRLMSERKIRHLPVVSGGLLVGVLSDRDLQFVETLHTLDFETAHVADAMSHEPAHAAPGDSLAAVAKRMAESKVGSILVVDAGRVVGLFTTIDALRALSQLAG
jgi:acetoin utilization protein AcuB